MPAGRGSNPRWFWFPGRGWPFRRAARGASGTAGIVGARGRALIRSTRGPSRQDHLLEAAANPLPFLPQRNLLQEESPVPRSQVSAPHPKNLFLRHHHHPLQAPRDAGSIP
jgi:hypothetical protein